MNTVQTEFFPDLDTVLGNIKQQLLIEPGLEELRTQVREKYLHAWNLNDHGHREEHFRDVEVTAHLIANRLGLQYRAKDILLAAYFHDLFSWSRDNHHELSSAFVQTTNCGLLSGCNYTLVADGCLYHRGSGNLPFPNEFAELICSADRGVPGNVGAMIARAMQTRFFKDPYMPELEAMEKSLSHIKEKYGSGGYVRYPAMYRKVFGGMITEQQKIIDSVIIVDGKFTVANTVIELPSQTV